VFYAAKGNPSLNEVRGGGGGGGGTGQQTRRLLRGVGFSPAWKFGREGKNK